MTHKNKIHVLSRAVIVDQDHIQLIWMPLLSINWLDFKPEPLKTLIPKWLELLMNNAFKSMMV